MEPRQSPDQGSTWYIRYNLQDSQFGNETRYSWGNGATNVFTGDFNHDSWTDIGVTGTENHPDGTWYIRYNLGNGQFGNETRYWWGNEATNVFAGDFNHDGWTDIGVTGTENHPDGTWYIRYNLGNGQFGNETRYWWGNGVSNRFTGDFDCDGWPDIGVTGTENHLDGTWYIRYNLGNGQFGNETRYTWGNAATNVFAGNFDGDCLADIGVTGTENHPDGTWYIRYYTEPMLSLDRTFSALPGNHSLDRMFSALPGNHSLNRMFEAL